MLNKLIKSTLAVLLFPLLAFATNTTSPDEIILTVNPEGEIIEIYQNSWTHSGSKHQNYLDHAHTQCTWNDIDLEHGTYKWTIDLDRKNGEKGKVNLEIKIKYANGSKEHPVNKKRSTNKDHYGTFGLPDYRSKPSETSEYGRIKDIYRLRKSNFPFFFCPYHIVE